MMKPNNIYVCFLIYILVFLGFNPDCRAEQTMWHDKIHNRFGGQIRLEGGVSGYDDGSYYEPVGTETGLDGVVNLRLTDRLDFSDRVYAEAHYEAILRVGDTYEKHEELKKIFPSLPGVSLSDPSNMDQQRLFDLTKTIKQTDDAILWNRLDRLFISTKPSWGDVTIGRQAVTWGNGMIFNPMDLFNPFSPSDIIRDYKIGDDLLSIRGSTDLLEEINLLYVPRRNVTTGDVSFDKSSVAGKAHFFSGNIEVDVMGAIHYDEIVLGWGGSGDFGNAAWRCDFIWSSLKEAADKSGYIEFVANIDYSWVWFSKNMYGLIEYYHNGLGNDNYTDALGDPLLMERIGRGELFALGKNYLNGQIQLELHPLFNLHLNAINNISDPSGLLQPWAIFGMTQNSTLMMGANIFYGSRGSEYGGFLIPGTSVYTNAAADAYLLFTFYF